VPNTSFDEQSRPSLARGARLQTDPTNGEPILLFPEGVLHLSESAQAIVSLCNGERKIAEIIDALATEYEVERQTLHQDVLDALADLYQRKVVVF